MLTTRRLLGAFLGFVLVQAVLIPVPAFADGDPGGALAVSYIQGDVGVQRGDDAQAVAAVRNAPLLPGDIISTGNASYAEIHMGRGIRLRLDSNSQIRVAAIDQNGSEVQLGQGNVEMRLFTAGSAQVDTPQIGVAANQPGVYTISVLGDGSSAVQVASGTATVLTQSGAQTPVSAGQSVHATGSADNPAVAFGEAPGVDVAFATFNASRDATLARAFAQRQAAAQMDGAEDLAGYGRWVNTPYGPSWVPTEPASWTPYSAGQWVYEPYYGYVWVGTEPWGWAPYHYGRWFVQPGVGWVWVPGAPAPWAPAMVAFVATAGAIAWLALAPHDAFHPWWGPHATTIVVNNISVYRNYRVAHAFVSVPVAAFRAGNFRGVHTVAYTSLGHPTVVNVTRVVVPTRANLAFGARPLAQPVIRAAVFQTNRFAGHSVAIQRSTFTAHTTTTTRTTFGPTRPATTTTTRTTFGPTRPATTTTTRTTFGPTNTYSRPATTYSRPTTTYKPNYQNTYRSPSTTNTYGRPATTNTYSRPTTTNTYSRPATTNTYSRPATTNTYSRPATTNTYSRPTTTNTYSRPATTNTYSRPATTNTYSRPATTQSHPTTRSTPRP